MRSIASDISITMKSFGPGIVQIAEFPSYGVAREGHIWNLKKRKELKPVKKNSGYMQVSLCNKGKTKSCLIHRLVLETFIGPCPNGMECCHGNGNPGDNRLENLRWDTKSSNQLDRNKHGTSNLLGRVGEKHYQHKLSETEVKWIRLVYAHKLFFQRELADLFNVSKTTISFVVNKKRWEYL